MVYRFVKATAPNGVVTPGHFKSAVNVAKDVIAVGAIDDGTGTMVAWDELPPTRRLA